MVAFTTALVAALSSGAMAAGKDVATSAIKDSYKALKNFILSKIGTAKPALDVLETEMQKDKPDAALEEQVVAKAIAGLPASEEAKRLMAQLVEAIQAAGATEPALVDVDRIRVARDFVIEDVELSGGLLRSEEVIVETGDFRISGIRQNDKKKA
jgi:hypothetical protein